MQGAGRLEYTYLNGALARHKVYVIDNETGITIDSYRILIFGDVNGDGVINAVDSDVCTLVQDWMIVWDETEDAAFYEAGDVNGDSRVDAIDADIIMAHANWVISIDQTAGRAGAN